MADSAAERSPAFDLRNVEYRYQDVVALSELSLAIPQGKRTVLLGANGSGKSTLLHLLDALYFPTNGAVLAFGEPLDANRFEDDEQALAFRRRVGFVFQNPDLQLFNASVYDEIAFGPLQLNWTAERVSDRVEEMLVAMGLAHLRDRPPHRLSGGEKKRVALASVLILDPDVLLLDEPTASLDPRSGSQLIETLIDWGARGKTLVMATHALDVVEDVADLCIVLHEGRVVAEGTPTRILGDGELLQRTGLVHAHRHRHADGSVHLHQHFHRALGGHLLPPTLDGGGSRNPERKAKPVWRQVKS